MDDRNSVRAFNLSGEIRAERAAHNSRWGGQHDRIVRAALQSLIDRPHQSILRYFSVSIDAHLTEEALDMLEMGLGMLARFGQRQWIVRPVTERHEQIEDRRRVLHGQLFQPCDQRIERVLLIRDHEVAHLLSLPEHRGHLVSPPDHVTGVARHGDQATP